MQENSYIGKIGFALSDVSIKPRMIQMEINWISTLLNCPENLLPYWIWLS